MRFLHLEDEFAYFKGLCFQLEKCGHTAVWLKNAEHVTSIVPEVQPDIVITAFFLSVVSGVEGVRRMRAAGIDIPVVVVSHYAHLERYTQGFRDLGIAEEDIISKSGNPEKDVEAVLSRLRERGLIE